MTYSQFLVRLVKMQRKEVVALAKRAGVSPHTLMKVWNGETRDPGIRLFEAVCAAMEAA